MNDLAAPTLALFGDPVDQKVRYLSFRISHLDAGKRTAARVTFVDMPSPYEAWNGVQMWVGENKEYCENAGQAEEPAEGCGSSPGVPRHMRASGLQCDPYFTDWIALRTCGLGTTLGDACTNDDDCDGECQDTIDVFGEGIVPNGVYDVQLIDETCDNQGLPENSFSAPLRVVMSRWGDVVKDCSGTPCGPPDDSVDVTTDVTAILDKFKNSKDALPNARSDIEPQVPDQKINISDVTFALDGFRGRIYPPSSFPDPSSPPCLTVTAGR